MNSFSDCISSAKYGKGFLQCTHVRTATIDTNVIKNIAATFKKYVKNNTTIPCAE